LKIIDANTRIRDVLSKKVVPTFRRRENLSQPNPKNIDMGHP
jgi:hypothetical protein